MTAPNEEGSKLLMDMLVSCVQYEVVCKDCKELVDDTDELTDLTVELQDTIEQAIAQSLKSEIIPGYTCINCQSMNCRRINSEVHNFANNLIVTINRFTETGVEEGLISYSRTLDLTSFVPGAKYKLQALIAARALYENPSYVLYAKRRHSWYYFENNDVGRVKLNEVLNQNPYVLIYERDDSN